MDFYERIDEAFKRLNVNRAQVGRDTGVSGQAVTQKLKRKSLVSPDEIEIYARYAHMTAAEALGEGSVVIQKKDEVELLERYRQMTPEQQARQLGTLRDLTPERQEVDPAEVES